MILSGSFKLGTSYDILCLEMPHEKFTSAMMQDLTPRKPSYTAVFWGPLAESKSQPQEGEAAGDVVLMHPSAHKLSLRKTEFSSKPTALSSNYLRELNPAAKPPHLSTAECSQLPCNQPISP